MKSALFIFACAGVMSATTSIALDQRSNDPILLLKEFRPYDGRENLNAALEALRAHMHEAPAETWGLIKPLLNDSEVMLQVKLPVMKSMIEFADAAAAKAMIRDAAKWTQEQIKQSPKVPSRDKNISVDYCGLILAAIIEDPRWQAWAMESPQVEQFILNVGLGAIDSLQMPPLAINAVKTLPFSIETKRQFAETIILEGRRSTLAQPLYLFLDEKSLTLLREKMQESVGGLEQFHFGCARALSYLGDTEAVPILQAQLKNLKGTPPAKAVRGMIHRIEIQNPPAKLLEWIAAPETATMEGMHEVPWAMTRALEYGFAPEDIRRAVLRHASHVSGKEFAWMLFQVKDKGRELGVLQEGDLAEFETPGIPGTWLEH